MARLGRFDIYHPNGWVDQVALTADRISVGSAAENTVVLRGDLVAAYHFELRLEAGGVALINHDSRHGTRVSGVMLRDSQPHALGDVAEIQIGGLRIVFHAGSDQPTLPIAAVADKTQVVAPAFDLRLDPSRIAVFPTSAASVEITISNRLASEQRFEIAVEGLAEEWTTLSQATAAVGGGESHAVYLYITPPRRVDVAPGDYPLAIAVKSAGLAGREQRRSLTIALGGFSGLSLAVDPTEIDGNAFRLYLLNQGNVALPLSLSASSADAGLKISLAQDRAHLDAGQRAQITGHVTGKRPLAGHKRRIPIALHVQAENASGFRVGLPATVLLRPRIPARALAAVLILTAAFLAYLAVTGTQRPAPVVNSSELSANQVASGTPVSLRWQAEAADRYVIEADGVAIAELPAAASEYIFSTDQLRDPVEIALIAAQEDDRAIEARELLVYQPAVVLKFSSDRSAMWRNVEERLVIEWQVEGAEWLEVAIPEGFQAMYDERSGTGEGRMALLGAPRLDFDLRLSADDELGNRLERRIAIRVLDPECKAIRDTPVFAGPDARFPRTHTAIENVPVLVTGVNPGKNWLRMTFSNGESGWGFRGGFFCEGFDPGALAVIKDVPQLPTASAKSESTPPSTALASAPSAESRASETATASALPATADP